MSVPDSDFEEALLEASGTLLLLAPATYILLRGKWHLVAQQRWPVLAYGVLAVAGAQLCYFQAVTRIPAAVALLLIAATWKEQVAYAFDPVGARAGGMRLLILDLVLNMAVAGLGSGLARGGGVDEILGRDAEAAQERHPLAVVAEPHPVAEEPAHGGFEMPDPVGQPQRDGLGPDPDLAVEEVAVGGQPVAAAGAGGTVVAVATRATTAVAITVTPRAPAAAVTIAMVMTASWKVQAKASSTISIAGVRPPTCGA